MNERTEIRIDWHGERVTAAIEAELSQRVGVASEYLRSQTVRNLRRNKTRMVGPSAPGQVPHVDTGFLSNSIFTRMVGRLEAIVGTALMYGLWLQEGTRRMGARPFFTITLAETADRIRAILTRRIN